MSLDDMYFDRQGNPITMEVWAHGFASKEDFDRYKRVAETDLNLDGVKLWVSTVWLGLDHNFGRLIYPDDPDVDQRPYIFETMVFGLPNDMEIQYRYATEEEAREGHEAIVNHLRSGKFRRLLEGDEIVASQHRQGATEPGGHEEES